MLTLHRQEQGDTIVEVMIAIAIASLILVSAYVISNQNTQAIQNTEERVQAQHLVESQIEALRVSGSISSPNVCFVGTAAMPAASCTINQPGSGADYAVAISQSSGVYTVKATWTSLGGHGNNDSNVTMFYRVQ